MNDIEFEYVLTLSFASASALDASTFWSGVFAAFAYFSAMRMVEKAWRFGP